MAEKKSLEEKLSDFERKGTHWLELMRNWIIEANQAENLIRAENLSGMKDFLVDIGSNRRIAAGMLAGEFGKPFFVKSNLVDLRGIEPLTLPCHGSMLPVYHRPILINLIMTTNINKEKSSSLLVINNSNIPCNRKSI